VRLELLAYEDDAAVSRHVVLMDQSAQRLYAAQTGLITTQAGVALPNHLTPMTVAPGERTLTAGVQELTLKFESPAVDGRKLIKTYTLKRGEYTMAVRHEFVNQGPTPLSAELYLQLARDGNIDGGPAEHAVAGVHLHRPGDVQRRQQVQEDRVHRHRQGQGRARQAQRQRLDRHGAALFRFGLAGAGRRPA
jgi:YidC/Oxa1 family membrane protein insertase